MEPHGFKEVTKQCTNKDHYQSVQAWQALLAIKLLAAELWGWIIAALARGIWSSCDKVRVLHRRQHGSDPTPD